MSLSSENTVMTMPVAPAYGGGYSNGNGMWGGDWASWIILFLIFGLFGGRGWGGFGGNDSSCCAPATCADLQRGFDNQGVTNKLNGLENGLCSLGYDQLREMNGINTNVLQTGFGIQNAIQQGTVAGMQNTNAIQAQLASCCCDIEKGQLQLGNAMERGFCNLGNTVQTSARDIIDSNNANYRALSDQLTAFRMEDKDNQIRALENQVNALNLAVSQRNQNDYLVNTLRPCPVPAYPACAPASAYTYPVSNGCGCNSCC